MGCTNTTVRASSLGPPGERAPFSEALGLLIALSVLGFVAVIYLRKRGTHPSSARHDSHFHTGLPAPVRPGCPPPRAAAPCRCVVRLASPSGGGACTCAGLSRRVPPALHPRLVLPLTSGPIVPCAILLVAPTCPRDVPGRSAPVRWRDGHRAGLRDRDPRRAAPLVLAVQRVRHHASRVLAALCALHGLPRFVGGRAGDNLGHRALLHHGTGVGGRAGVPWCACTRGWVVGWLGGCQPAGVQAWVGVSGVSWACRGSRAVTRRAVVRCTRTTTRASGARVERCTRTGGRAAGSGACGASAL